MYNFYNNIKSLWCTCAHCYRMSKYAVREQKMRQGFGVGGEGRNFSTNQDEVLLWGGRGVLGESWVNKRFFWVIFHPVKAQEAQEMHICPKVRGLQNSNVNSLGWNDICHRARLHFCKLVRHMWFIGLTVYFRILFVLLQVAFENFK